MNNRRWYETTAWRIVVGICGIIVLASGIMTLMGGLGVMGEGESGIDMPWNTVVDDDSQTVVISFRGGDGATGSVDPIQARLGSSIVLPENGFERSGSTFVGWVAGSDSDGEPIEAGIRVVVEDETVYTAVWTDANDADDGKTTDESKSTDDGKVERDTASEKSTAWAELVVHDGDEELNGTMEGWDGKALGGLILVTNETGRVINLDATLTLVHRSGNEWLSSEAVARAVVPGGVAFIHVADLNRSGGLKYHIEVTDAWDWVEPLEGNLQIEEVSADSEQVTVRLTNKSEHEEQINSVRLVATSKDGKRYGGDAFSTGQLQPGESSEVTFTAKNMFDFYTFTSFDGTNCTYYVDGFVNLNKDAA